MNPDLYNLIFQACCGCTYPSGCGEAQIRCESLTHSSFCNDDDYTDSWDKWDRAVKLHGAWVVDHNLIWQANHDQWEIDHAQWEIDQAQWIEDHVAWVAAMEEWNAGYDIWYNDIYFPWYVCMSENPDTPEVCGDEPTYVDPPPQPPEPIEPEEPVEPLPEPAMPGTEPSKPAGYDDVEHGCYGPWVEPAFPPDYPLPTIFRTFAKDYNTGDSITGQFWIYNGMGTSETLNGFTYGGSYADISQAASANWVDPADSVCKPDSGYTGGSVGAPYFFDLPGIETEGPVHTCTETVRTVEQEWTTVQGAIPLELKGCPPTNWSGLEESWNLTNVDKNTYTLGSGISRFDLLDRAVENIGSYPWPYEGSTHTGPYCSAMTHLDIWPNVQDLYVPISSDPVVMGWPACEDWGDSDPFNPSAKATSRKSRYKVGISQEYMQHRLWEEQNAGWVACNELHPGECGEVFPEPPIYKYFAVQWDIVEFPRAWDEWRDLYDEWQDAKELHDAWEECEAVSPGFCGTEPVVPPDPSGDQPDERPVMVSENLFWEWTGGEEEHQQYSDWFYIDAPIVEAERRIVNQMTKCYRSGVGAYPMAYGETYNPNDYPP